MAKRSGKLELVSITPGALVSPGITMDLAGAFLAGRNARTLLAYRKDLVDFQSFLNAPSLQAAASIFTTQGPGAANGQALAYRVSLQERDLAPATINRRLAALRSMVKLGRVLGLVSWELEVEGIKAATYRDTRGPGWMVSRRWWRSWTGSRTPNPSGTWPSCASSLGWPSAGGRWSPWTSPTWTWRPGASP